MKNENTNDITKPVPREMYGNGLSFFEEEIDIKKYLKTIETE